MYLPLLRILISRKREEKNCNEFTTRREACLSLVFSMMFFWLFTLIVNAKPWGPRRRSRRVEKMRSIYFFLWSSCFLKTTFGPWVHQDPKRRVGVLLQGTAGQRFIQQHLSEVFQRPSSSLCAKSQFDVASLCVCDSQDQTAETSSGSRNSWSSGNSIGYCICDFHTTTSCENRTLQYPILLSETTLYRMCSTSQRIPHAPACESLVCEVAKRFGRLHKQLIQMLVHGCVGRSETQTIDEGDEGQVCPCWCVQKGPFLPCQHGQSCWKVLLMKFMRGWLVLFKSASMDYKASRCGVADASLHHHKWGHIVAPLGVVQRCISSNRGKEKILYFLIPPCAFKWGEDMISLNLIFS